MVYDGTPPVMPPIKAMDASGDAPKCHEGPDRDQTWVIGKNNGVANVAVYLEPAGGKFFAIDEQQAKEQKHDASIDQPYCVYEPYLVGIFAAYKTADGQVHDLDAKLVVKNSGVLSHNTKIKGNDRVGNGLQNLTLNAKEEKVVPVKYQKELLDVGCDKHTWMKARIKTFDNPYFAITDKDGNFEIKNAPSGVDVVVKLWHEAGSAKDEAKTFTKGANELPLKIKAAS